MLILAFGMTWAWISLCKSLFLLAQVYFLVFLVSKGLEFL